MQKLAEPRVTAVGLANTAKAVAAIGFKDAKSVRADLGLRRLAAAPPSRQGRWDLT